jgi:arylformamidase
MADMVEQVAASIRYLRAQYPARRLVLVGHSAGGHLASLMLWRPDVAPLVAAIVSASGLFDLTDVRACYANEALRLSASDVDQFSPTRLAATTRPYSVQVPVLLAVAQHDPDRFREQSVEFAANLRLWDVPVTLRDYQDRDHFDLVENLRLDSDPFAVDLLSFCGL